MDGGETEGFREEGQVIKEVQFRREGGEVKKKTKKTAVKNNRKNTLVVRGLR